MVLNKSYERDLIFSIVWRHPMKRYARKAQVKRRGFLGFLCERKLENAQSNALTYCEGWTSTHIWSEREMFMQNASTWSKWVKEELMGHLSSSHPSRGEINNLYLYNNDLSWSFNFTTMNPYPRSVNQHHMDEMSSWHKALPPTRSAVPQTFRRRGKQTYRRLSSSQWDSYVSFSRRSLLTIGDAFGHKREFETRKKPNGDKSLGEGNRRPNASGDLQDEVVRSVLKRRTTGDLRRALFLHFYVYGTSIDDRSYPL